MVYTSILAGNQETLLLAKISAEKFSLSVTTKVGPHQCIHKSGRQNYKQHSPLPVKSHGQYVQNLQVFLQGNLKDYPVDHLSMPRKLFH